MKSLAGVRGSGCIRADALKVNVVRGLNSNPKQPSKQANIVLPTSLTLLGLLLTVRAMDGFILLGVVGHIPLLNQIRVDCNVDIRENKFLEMCQVEIFERCE